MNIRLFAQLLISADILLKQIPKEGWSHHKTDVRLVKSAQPTHIKLKAGMVLPYKKHYPLKQQAVESIESTIEDLLFVGVLIKTQSLCHLSFRSRSQILMNIDWYTTPLWMLRHPSSHRSLVVHSKRFVPSIFFVFVCPYIRTHKIFLQLHTKENNTHILGIQDQQLRSTINISRLSYKNCANNSDSWHSLTVFV